MREAGLEAVRGRTRAKCERLDNRLPLERIRTAQDHKRLAGKSRRGRWFGRMSRRAVDRAQEVVRSVTQGAGCWFCRKPAARPMPSVLQPLARVKERAA